MKEFYNPDIIIGCKVANNPANRMPMIFICNWKMYL
jgi:hypothetical protein